MVPSSGSIFLLNCWGVPIHILEFRCANQVNRGTFFFFVVLVTFASFFEFCGSNTHTVPCNRFFPDPTFFCAFVYS